MRVFLQSIVGQLLLTFYIGHRGGKVLADHKILKRIFKALLLLEVTIFMFGFIFHETLPDSIMIPIFYLCNTWYIASLYLTLMILIPDVILFIDKRHPFLPDSITRNKGRIGKLLFVVILTADVAIMYQAHQNVKNPVITEKTIHIDKKAGERKELTIAMVSDTHFGEMIGQSFAKTYVEKINATNPDVIVFVGDILDYESRIAENNRIETFIQQLKAPLGIYGVNGNHEFRANINAKQKWFVKAGITMINDSVVSPDSTFYLIGRNDFINRNRKTLHELMHGIDRSKPTIVLNHQPESFAETVMNKADLELCGHTHNGQFQPYSLLMKLVFECSYGYYRKGASQFYVSSGLGFAGPPYRVGTRSEIVLLHLKFRE